MVVDNQMAGTQDRTAIGKKVSALKVENRYIDACRVVCLGFQMMWNTP